MNLSDWLDWKDKRPEWLAERIDVDPVSVRRYCAGTRRPAWEVMAKIVAVTEGAVTANDFLSKRSSPEKDDRRVA